MRGPLFDGELVGLMAARNCGLLMSAMRLWKPDFGWLTMLIVGIAIAGCAASSGDNSSSDATPVVHVQNRPTALDPLMAKAPEAPSDKLMTMEAEFANRDQKELDQVMAQILDPHSPRYHHWITPEEVHARFGETQAQFDAVAAWLQSEGMTITDKSYGTNEDYIRFSGTVAQVDRAFHVHIMEPQFELYVPKEAPSIPAQFNGVIARINGLDNVGFLSSGAD
jgi:hypothetical protein